MEVYIYQWLCLWFRFPFLLVDRVIEYNPGVSAVAIKNVTINDNFFPGHFPERPIMPGVLMIEVIALSHIVFCFVFPIPFSLFFLRYYSNHKLTLYVRTLIFLVTCI